MIREQQQQQQSNSRAAATRQPQRTAAAAYTTCCVYTAARESVDCSRRIYEYRDCIVLDRTIGFRFLHFFFCLVRPACRLNKNDDAMHAAYPLAIEWMFFSRLVHMPAVSIAEARSRWRRATSMSTNASNACIDKTIQNWWFEYTIKIRTRVRGRKSVHFEWVENICFLDGCAIYVFNGNLWFRVLALRYAYESLCMFCRNSLEVLANVLVVFCIREKLKGKGSVACGKLTQNIGINFKAIRKLHNICQWYVREALFPFTHEFSSRFARSRSLSRVVLCLSPVSIRILKTRVTMKCSFHSSIGWVAATQFIYNIAFSIENHVESVWEKIGIGKYLCQFHGINKLLNIFR